MKWNYFLFNLINNKFKIGSSSYVNVSEWQLRIIGCYQISQGLRIPTEYVTKSHVTFTNATTASIHSSCCFKLLIYNVTIVVFELQEKLSSVFHHWNWLMIIFVNIIWVKLNVVIFVISFQLWQLIYFIF